MDFAKKQPGFMYLDKNGFYFYEVGLTTVLSLAFTTTSVKDMDVLNRAALIDQIQGFITQYKLPPAEFLIILSPNITFEKDIVGLNQESTRQEVEKFIDTVPFDSIMSKGYPIDKGVKVIASNDDLYRELKAGFEKSLFAISGVIPYQMLGQDQELIKNLTTENALELIKKIDRLKNLSIVILSTDKPQTPVVGGVEKKNEIVPKKNKTRLFAMIGVFAILFIVLGVMIVNI